MKLSKILSLSLLIIMVASLASCGILFPKQEDTITGSETKSETTSDISSEATGESTTESQTTPIEDVYDTITIAEALELCGESGNITTERYYIRAIIKTVTNTTYGEMVIYDETGEIGVYGTYSSDGELKYSELDEKPVKGDEVLLHCILQNHEGTKEIKNARLIEFKSNQGSQDISAYKAATISEARSAAEGEKLKVGGIVARITYANGMKASGFMLVNGADAIYVYDNDAAAQVSIGNRVEIAASKTYWINESEQNNAATHGYKGCNQLEDVIIVSNDKANNDWTNADFAEWTVKDIMDNPVENDITTQVFKVTALVKKSPGAGFTNYYIDDLDGVTGSYVYTQCNGSDFEWLDEFDGKICTVYLTALNAKATNAGCVYRFLPVAVIDEGFVFDTDNTAKFAVQYHGVTQFDTTYTGNPELQLVTSVSSELLGFENATLSYTSSDESIISIDTTSGTPVMNCLTSGTATITITGTYGTKQYSKEITVTVNISNEDIPSVTVKQAIDAAVGEIVTVKGIVGPSLVNQVGFYLIDESGVIAVTLSNEELSKVKLGHEVILTGTRAVKHKDGSSEFGQTNLMNCEIVLNNYGTNDYSTASFTQGKTVPDFLALKASEDHSTEVYVISGTVKVVETQHYTNIYVSDGTNDILLYTSSASQYNWMKEYAGQNVTFEIAPCNWNCKGYKGCVLAVITESGEKICNTLNFGE